MAKLFNPRTVDRPTDGPHNPNYMSFKFHEGQESVDENLKPWVWLNDDTQSHVFRSMLGEKYPVTLFPQMWERHPKITCKPGRLVVLPHRYYKIFTRDDSPAKGKQMFLNEAVENYSEKSLYRGEEAHENRHEKKKGSLG